MNDLNIQVELNKQAIHTIQLSQVRQEKLLEEIQKSNKEMFNHFTEKYEAIFKDLKDRLPRWAVWSLNLLCLLLGAVLSGVLSG